MTKTISRERLEELAVEDDLYNYPPTKEELNAMARMLLAALDSEPTGYLYRQNTDLVTTPWRYTETLPDYVAGEGWEVRPQFDTPATVAVPDKDSSLPNLEFSTLLKIISGEIRGGHTVAVNLARHLVARTGVSISPVPKATKQSMREAFPSLSDYECVVAADVWNSCRAAMLNGGKS